MVMSSQKSAFRDHCRGRVLELIHGISSWQQCISLLTRTLPYLLFVRTHVRSCGNRDNPELSARLRSKLKSVKTTINNNNDHGDTSSTGTGGLVCGICPPWGGCLPADVSLRRFVISSWCWACASTSKFSNDVIIVGSRGGTCCNCRCGGSSPFSQGGGTCLSHSYAAGLL